MSSTTHKFLGTVAVLGAMAMSGHAHAQATNDDVAALKAQLRALEKKLDNVQKQATATQKQQAVTQANFANANAAMHKKAVPFIDARLTMKEKRLTDLVDSDDIPLLTAASEEDGLDDIKSILDSYERRKTR